MTLHLTSITRRYKLDAVLPARAETTARLAEELRNGSIIAQAIAEDRRERRMREPYYTR